MFGTGAGEHGSMRGEDLEDGAEVRNVGLTVVKDTRLKLLRL